MLCSHTRPCVTCIISVFILFFISPPFSMPFQLPARVSFVVGRCCCLQTVIYTILIIFTVASSTRLHLCVATFFFILICSYVAVGVGVISFSSFLSELRCFSELDLEIVSAE